MAKEIIINEYDNPDIFDTHKIDDYDKFLQEIAPIINYINFGYDTIRESDEATYIYKNTSKEMPYTYKFDATSMNIFYLDEEFYEENYEEAKQKLLDIITNTKSERFTIANKKIIDDDIIDALSRNHNIKYYCFLDDYTISKEYISKLKRNPNIEEISVPKVEEDIRFIYDQVVNAANQYDVCGLYVAMLSKLSDRKEQLYYPVSRDYTDEELEDLKKIIKTYSIPEIRISFYKKTQIDKILDILKDSKVIIEYNNSFSIDEIITTEKYDNVIFSNGGNDFTPIQIRKKEEILDLIRNEVKNENLSPLEEYMYLYNTVKLFKEYNESEDNKQLSRAIEYIFDNDYMVCVGYANLLNELVERLNNPNIKTTTFSLDAGEKGKEKEGHKRLLVNIKDDKYNIDGIYISDPTWDSVTYYEKEEIDGKKEINYTKPISHVDKYSYFLLTKEEIDSDKYEYDPNITDVLFSKKPEQTIQEFLIGDKKYLVFNSVFALRHLFYDDSITVENVLNYCVGIKQQPIDEESLIKCITNVYSKIYKDTPKEIQAEIIERTIENNYQLQKHHFGEESGKFSK